jgi:hypothetical protein
MGLRYRFYRDRVFRRLRHSVCRWAYTQSSFKIYPTVGAGKCARQSCVALQQADSSLAVTLVHCLSGAEIDQPNACILFSVLFTSNNKLAQPSITFVDFKHSLV